MVFLHVYFMENPNLKWMITDITGVITPILGHLEKWVCLKMKGWPSGHQLISNGWSCWGGVELLNTVEAPSSLGTNEAIFVGKICPRITVWTSGMFKPTMVFDGSNITKENEAESGRIAYQIGCWWSQRKLTLAVSYLSLPFMVRC